MKYCEKCGNANNDSARFCEKCGAACGGQSSANTYVQNQGYVQPVGYAPNFGKQISLNPSVNAVKVAGSSGGFITMAIAYSVAVLVSLIGIFVTANSLSSISRYAAPYMNKYSSEMYMLGSGSAAVTVIMGLLGLIPSIITLIGIWKVFAESRKPGDGFNASGLTMINVIVWIEFAFICLLGVVGLIISIISGIAADSAGLFLLLFLITAIIIVPTILYYIFIAKSVARAKNTALSGVLQGKASVYVIVINFLMAFASLLSVISTSSMSTLLSTLYYELDLPAEVVNFLASLLGGSGAVNIITGLANITVLVAASVVMINYNSKIRTLPQGAAVAYAQPSYRPNVNPYSQTTQPIPPTDSASNVDETPKDF